MMIERIKTEKNQKYFVPTMIEEEKRWVKQKAGFESYNAITFSPFFLATL
jgi:hypothetical protein